jgi:UDP:flavonoid glycosyltransferase YjiC (YdhE family)
VIAATKPRGSFACAPAPTSHVSSRHVHFLAARVAWSGTGVDLRTARPQEAALRAAVDRVAHEASFRERAEAIRKEMARYDPFAAVAQIVAEDERTSLR